MARDNKYKQLAEEQLKSIEGQQVNSTNDNDVTFFSSQQIREIIDNNKYPEQEIKNSINQIEAQKSQNLQIENYNKFYQQNSYEDREAHQQHKITNKQSEITIEKIANSKPKGNSVSNFFRNLFCGGKKKVSSISR